MNNVLEIIQPERKKLAKEIELSKNLILFHNQLADHHQEKLEVQQGKMKELDNVIQKIIDKYNG